jgi:hypothetical protein
MSKQEKKYLVNDFNTVTRLLKEAAAPVTLKTLTKHYYAHQRGNDVVKLVDYGDRIEVHMLKEEDGKFTLTDTIPVANLESGLRRLKDMGFTRYAVLTMEDEEYGYLNGTVAIYTVNGSLRSVILEFSAGAHDNVARALGLESAEVINVPYNKYLEQKGLLEIKEL